MIITIKEYHFYMWQTDLLSTLDADEFDMNISWFIFANKAEFYPAR